MHRELMILYVENDWKYNQMAARCDMDIYAVLTDIYVRRN